MSEAKTQAEPQYITLLHGGKDFRTIAKEMTAKGYKMNHATARKVYNQAVEKVMVFVAKKLGVSTSEKIVEEWMKRSDIHHFLGEFIQTRAIRQ